MNTYHYFNPHDPPPDGHNRNRLIVPQRDHSRWMSANAGGKSVEVQRSQVDELFKSLKDGDGLPETEPSTLIMVSTAYQ